MEKRTYYETMGRTVVSCNSHPMERISKFVDSPIKYAADFLTNSLTSNLAILFFFFLLKFFINQHYMLYLNMDLHFTTVN